MAKLGVQPGKSERSHMFFRIVPAVIYRWNRSVVRVSKRLSDFILNFSPPALHTLRALSHALDKSRPVSQP